MSTTRFGPDRYKDGSLVEHWGGDMKTAIDEKQAPREVIAQAIDRPYLGGVTTRHGIAAVIIRSLAKAGYKIVAREPSEAMVNAGGRWQTLARDWRLMWDAAE